jgi:hypothetical protein
MADEPSRQNPFSLRSAINRAQAGQSPPEFLLTGRTEAWSPDPQPARRDGERRFDVPAAASRPSEPDLQYRREHALHRLALRGNEAPPATNEAGEAKSGPSALTICVCILLVGIIAGGVAFAIVNFSARQSATATGGEDVRGKIAAADSDSGRQPAKQAPHLTLNALSGPANSPIALGVDVDSPTPGSFVVVRGLPAGSRLSAGIQIRDGEWRVSLRDLQDAQVRPPQDYLGTLNLPIDLRNSDDRVLESRNQRLTWQAEQSAPVAAKPVKTEISGADPTYAPPAPPPSRNVQEAVATAGPDQSLVSERPVTSSPAAVEASRQVDAAELQNLMQRADAALENRDFAAARLLLERAAESGNAQAAIKLAGTYDPGILKQLGALGAQANVDRAREWYRKAADWGSAEAGRRLLELQRTAQ